MQHVFRHCGIIGIIWLGALALPLPVRAADEPVPAPAAAVQSEFSYENATIVEDVTWRGNVRITGSLVVAPQATIRIEPGTAVRFIDPATARQKPRLVVMGRLHCGGTPDNPVRFTTATPGPGAAWGGILFLASGKRNLLEHLTLDGAQTGIEAQFSNLEVRGAVISGAVTGMILRDSTLTLAASSISNCRTGLDIRDSETDLRETVLAANPLGIRADHSTLTLASVSVRESDQRGITAEECRIRINGGEIAGNRVGAAFRGGEGQLLQTRFTGNRELGLHLNGARFRIHRTLFADNSRDAIRADNARAVIWGSSFSGNGGYNLATSGSEPVNALLNWWGGIDEAAITAKISDAAPDPGAGRVTIFPWLPEQPAAVP